MINFEYDQIIGLKFYYFGPPLLCRRYGQKRKRPKIKTENPHKNQ